MKHDAKCSKEPACERVPEYIGVADHEAHWDHRGIYAEYATFRLSEYQWVGTIGPGKSLAAPAEPFEQAIHRILSYREPSSAVVVKKRRAGVAVDRGVSTRTTVRRSAASDKVLA